MGILTDRQIRDEGIVTPCEPCVTRPGVVSYGLTSYGYDARIGFRFRVFKPYPCAVIDPKAFDDRMFEIVDLRPEFADCNYCRNTGKEFAYGNYLDCEHCERCRYPDYITIPPHSFALGETIETFRIPRDCLAVVVGKSTYARCGLIVNVTPLEPEWHGVVTVELSNTTPLPLRVYAGEGIMQVLFLRSDGMRSRLLEWAKGLHAGYLGIGVDFAAGPDYTCEVSYADKKGRYQGQTGVTTPTVDTAVASKIVDCIFCDDTGELRSPTGSTRCHHCNTDAKPAQVAIRIVCPHCIAGRLNRMPNADCPHCAGLGFTYEV